jgi:hypothetical protein
MRDKSPGKRKIYDNVNIRQDNNIFGTNNVKMDFTIQRDFKKKAREISENRIQEQLRVYYNKLKQSISPFFGGRRNDEYINPVFKSKVFEEKNYNNLNRTTVELNMENFKTVDDFYKTEKDINRYYNTDKKKQIRLNLNMSTDDIHIDKYNILSRSLLIRNPNDDYRLINKVPNDISIDETVETVLNKSELEKIRLQNTLQGEVFGPYDTIERREYRLKLARERQEKNETICDKYLNKNIRDCSPRLNQYYRKVVK